jgi:hypothetical protein
MCHLCVKHRTSFYPSVFGTMRLGLGSDDCRMLDRLLANRLESPAAPSPALGRS